MNKKLTKIIDPTILIKHGLLKTLTSKFTIIWFSTLTLLTISMIIFLNLFKQGNVTMVSWNVIIVSLLMLLTISIFNIVNLNKLFSSDHELGIMNLELRKGRTKNSIFLSRLIANKILTLSYIILMMFIYLALTAIINKRDLNLFWMFLTYIPIDFVFTGVFLFFFGFFKYKMSIASSSILSILILLTPIMQLISIGIPKSTILPQWMAQSYVTDKVLGLAYEKKDKNSFVYKLLDEAQYFNQPLTESIDNSMMLSRNLLEVDGLLPDMPKILDNFWDEFEQMNISNNPKRTLEFSEEYKKSLFAKLNNKYSAKEGKYEQDYKNSLYLENKVTNKNYQKMIHQLSSLIKKINKDFQEYQDVQQFNQLVLEYAKGMIYERNVSWEEEAVIHDPILGDANYPHFFEQIWLNNDQTYMGYLDKTKLFKILTIPPELRMWNQITTQLLGSALDYEKEYMQKITKSEITKAFSIPWEPAFESWFFANPNLNFFETLRLNQENSFFNSLNYQIYNRPNYINKRNKDDSSDPSWKPFAELSTITKVNNQSKTKFKSFNVATFNLVIWTLGITLILISYLLFIKKIKK